MDEVRIQKEAGQGQGHTIESIEIEGTSFRLWACFPDSNIWV